MTKCEKLPLTEILPSLDPGQDYYLCIGNSTFPSESLQYPSSTRIDTVVFDKMPRFSVVLIDVKF